MNKVMYEYVTLRDEMQACEGMMTPLHFPKCLVINFVSNSYIYNVSLRFFART
jgi:hypothetical protein